MQKISRGQLSLEVLLVAAALFAFLALFLPSVSKVFDALSLHSIDSSQQKVLDEVYFKAREAAVLGPGTRFEFNSQLAAGSIFSFEQKPGSGIFKLSYSLGGKRRSLNKSVSFPLFVAPSANLSAGEYSLVVSNNGSGVLLSAEKRA